MGAAARLRKRVEKGQNQGNGQTATVGLTARKQCGCGLMRLASQAASGRVLAGVHVEHPTPPSIRFCILARPPILLLVTGFKPSDDGRAWIVRLFGASGKDCKATLTWAPPKPGKTHLSDTSEKPLEKIRGAIKVPAWGVVTLRVEP